MRTNTKVRLFVLLTAAVAMAVSRPGAQALTAVRFVQWPVFDGTTVGSGIRVDRTGDPGSESPAGTIWATSRQTDPKLVRLVPGTPLETAAATWTAWSLAPGEHNAEGIVITPADQVFVRTTVGLQRIDPSTNVRTVWPDGFSKSDLSLGADGSVWSALPFGPVQRLVPDGPASAGATITSWNIGGSGEISLAGVAVSPATGRVYFSDNGGDAIGELDPSSSQVRRWSVAAVGVTRPRQLSLDPSGDVWAVSKSNHIVRVRPSTNELTAFAIPTANSEAYGIFADGIVAFTQSALTRIGLLIPTGSSIVSAPAVATVAPTSFRLAGEMHADVPEIGTAMPVVTDVPTSASGSDATGFFVEATIPGTSSPLGIDRNPLDAAGTFYYTDLGGLFIGRASLPLPEEALVTGGGWIDVAGGRASFSFTAFRKDTGGPVKGRFQYQNHATGEIVQSVEIVDLLVYGTDAIFSGSLMNGGVPGTFTVQVSDRGEPGTNDTIRVTLSGATTANTLAGGNIQIHRKGKS
jgi:streptogramin lyase